MNYQRGRRDAILHELYAIAGECEGRYCSGGPIIKAVADALNLGEGLTDGELMRAIERAIGFAS